jgi:hypothetical protein
MWAMMLTMGLSTVFANNEETINQRAVNSFKKEFANAQDVNWVSSKDYVKATFKLNDQVMFAYYDHTGELLVITRNILSNQLPIHLLSGMKKDYQNYWITDLFELLSTENGTSYYVTLENADQKIVLKSTGSSGWDVFKKEKKN